MRASAGLSALGLFGLALLSGCSSPEFQADPGTMISTAGNDASKNALLPEEGSGGEGGEPATIGSGGEGDEVSRGGSGETGDAGGGGGEIDPGPEPCPELGGEPMVRAGDFCIDANEVTVENYKAFVAGEPEPQSDLCAWNVTYQPACFFSGDLTVQPVRCVDFCDAKAYCESVGKHLCGGKAGNALDYDAPPDDHDAQWYSACSNHGEKKFPYGGEYDAKACVGAGYGLSGVMTVKQAEGCEGGVPGLYDMSGSVGEWIDSCHGELGAADDCQVRGGGYTDQGDELACAATWSADRNLTSLYVGFRCCAE